MDINLIIYRHKNIYNILSVVGEVLFIVISLVYLLLTEIPYIGKKR